MFKSLRTFLVIALALTAGCVSCAAPAKQSTPTVVPIPTPTPMRAATPSPTASAIPPLLPPATPIPTPTPTNTPPRTVIACTETHGQIVRAQLASAFLGKQQGYRVYTPPCYDQQVDRRYPVVYLLHGAGHDDGYWDDVGIDEAADPLIAAGQIQPLLIVLPDGNRTYGPRTGEPPPYAGFLVNELVPQIERDYRTEADRAHRAIGGISLGGAWALLLAERYPELFSAVGGHSPAIGPLNNIYPDAQVFAAAKIRIYLDVGDADFLRDATADFDAALSAAHYPHEFHVYPGSHTEAYWNSHLEDYLRFYTRDWGA